MVILSSGARGGHEETARLRACLAEWVEEQSARLDGQLRCAHPVALEGPRYRWSRLNTSRVPVLSQTQNGRRTDTVRLSNHRS